MTNQIKIANGVENLVAHEFIVVTQAIGIENPIFIHDNSVFKRTSTRQSHAAQGFHILHETEGASASDFLDVGFETEIHLGNLPCTIDSRMIEFDEKLEFETIVWF